MQTFDNTRPLVAGMAVGVARACIERTPRAARRGRRRGRLRPSRARADRRRRRASRPRGRLRGRTPADAPGRVDGRQLEAKLAAGLLREGQGRPRLRGHRAALRRALRDRRATARTSCSRSGPATRRSSTSSRALSRSSFLSSPGSCWARLQPSSANAFGAGQPELSVTKEATLELENTSRRRPRRQPDPVRALERRLCQGLEPGHADRRARRVSSTASRSQGETSGRGGGRRRPQAQPRLQPHPRVRARLEAGARDAGLRRRPGVRDRPRGRDPRGQQDRARPGRVGRSPAASTPPRTRRSRSTTTCARSCSRPTTPSRTSTALRALAKVRPGHIVPEIPRNAEPRTGLSMGEHTAIMAREWGVTRAGAGRACGRQPPEPRRRLRPRLLRRPDDPLPRPRARPEPARRLDRREAREAEAGVRRRGRHDDGGQLDAALRRRLGRAARLRGVGGGARPEGRSRTSSTPRPPRSTTSARRRAC